MLWGDSIFHHYFYLCFIHFEHLQCPKWPFSQASYDTPYLNRQGCIGFQQIQCGPLQNKIGALFLDENPFLFSFYTGREGRTSHIMMRPTKIEIGDGVWAELTQIAWFFFCLFGALFSFLHGALVRGHPLLVSPNEGQSFGFPIATNAVDGDLRAIERDFVPTPIQARPTSHVPL